MIENNKIITQHNDLYIQLWREQMLFTWGWWLSVMVLILPWGIWLLLRKKESTGRLLLAGFFVFLITTFFDSIGVILGLWFYQVSPLPYFNSFFLSWNFSLFPVTIMLLLQLKPRFAPYLNALLFALSSAFIVEPLFHWLHIFEPVHWKYYYGLPFYFVYYLLADKVSKIKTFADLS